MHVALSEDATEAFQVKKSSVSRRLIKQKKKDRKDRDPDEDDFEEEDDRRPTSAEGREIEQSRSAKKSREPVVSL